MEHEIEKSIQGKVNEAEQLPVTWEKEWVWSQIGTSRTQKTFVFYYAAASLVMAAALFYYGAELTASKQLELRLKSLELSIEENRSYQAGVLAKNNSAIELPSCVEPLHDSENKMTVASKALKKTKSIEYPAVISTTENEKQEVVASTDIIDANRESTPPLVIEKTFSIPLIENVRAIISGGDRQNYSSHERKEKKLTFRLFPPAAEIEPANIISESITISSRINHR